jgi:hypothetical protein
MPEASSFLRHIPQINSSNKNDTTTWSTMGVKFTANKTGI